MPLIYRHLFYLPIYCRYNVPLSSDDDVDDDDDVDPFINISVTIVNNLHPEFKTLYKNVSILKINFFIFRNCLFLL